MKIDLRVEVSFWTTPVQLPDSESNAIGADAHDFIGRWKWWLCWCPLGRGGCRWQLGNARRGTNRALPDGSAVDSIIDEPLVQSGEYLVDGSAWCELGNKERYKKYSEDPHGD